MTREQEKPDKTYRTSCPSCGRILFRLKSVEPTTASVTIEVKCKGGGCHKLWEVGWEAGRLTIAAVT